MSDRIAGERLAAVEQRLTDHEARCEERLSEIKASAASTLKAVEGLKSRFWAITLALLTWSLAQIWSASPTRVAQLEAPHPGNVRQIVDVGVGPSRLERMVGR
jgi:hypothetical protein